MPERLAYDEAMQFSTIRLKIPDPELKQGHVEMVSVATTQGPMERPWGIEGGFAVVYKFRRQNGSICAMRCFRVPMSPDTQFRYERIGPYFHAHAGGITAGFKYYDEAIVVKEQGKPQNQKYPVIEMDWIDGVTLVDKVNELCRKRQSAALKDLAIQWIDMLRVMEQAHIAHGDLAGVNVMVRVDGRLVLIDYDGVYIPEFVGLSQVLLGQDDFQHPHMTQRHFSEHMDAFSALVIYTALIALAAKPELWNSYAKLAPDGKLLDTNMLFRQQDFQNPQHSSLFRDLEQLHDPHVKTMVQELKRACQQSIHDVRFPFALVDPEYKEKQALAQLESALQTQDDEQIAAAWLPVLEKYAPAQRHRNRAQLAHQRVKAIQNFRQALTTGNLQYILNNYDVAQLDASQSITNNERLLLSLAPAFLRAYREDNDDALELAERLQNTVQATRVVFTPQQQQRFAYMRQRRNVQQALVAAFRSNAVEQIAALSPLLHYIKQVTSSERERIVAAVRFMQAYQSSDDTAFLIACDALQRDAYPFVLTREQEQRAALIRRRREVQEQFHLALISRSPWRLVKAYDPLLDSNGQLGAVERERLDLARLFVDALRSDADDDELLVAANEALQKSTISNLFDLTQGEQQRIKLAKQRMQALDIFRQTLRATPNDAQRIVDAYNAPLLNASSAVTEEERATVTAAQRYLAMYEAVHAGIQTANDDLIRSAYEPELAQRFAGITSTEQQHIERAMLTKDLEDLLDRKNYGRALLLAHSIQKTTGQPISELLTFKLKRATMRFVREQDLSDLSIQIEERQDGNYATVSWRWPATTLIQTALIAWQSDDWPDSPSAKSWSDPQWHGIWTRRKNNVLHSSETFPIGKGAHIYVRGYAALLDGWGQEKIWRFSDGSEPTSYAEAESPRVTWRIQ